MVEWVPQVPLEAQLKMNTVGMEQVVGVEMILVQVELVELVEHQVVEVEEVEEDLQLEALVELELKEKLGFGQLQVELVLT